MYECFICFIKRKFDNTIFPWIHQISYKSLWSKWGCLGRSSIVQLGWYDCFATKLKEKKGRERPSDRIERRHREHRRDCVPPRLPRRPQRDPLRGDAVRGREEAGDQHVGVPPEVHRRVSQAGHQGTYTSLVLFSYMLSHLSKCKARLVDSNMGWECRNGMTRVHMTKYTWQHNHADSEKTKTESNESCFTPLALLCSTVDFNWVKHSMAPHASSTPNPSCYAMLIGYCDTFLLSP